MKQIDGQIIGPAIFKAGIRIESHGNPADNESIQNQNETI
jgi:hypothetical protein